MPLPMVPAPQTQIVLMIMFKIKCKDNVDGPIGFSAVSLIFSKPNQKMEPVQQMQTTATAASAPGLFGTKIPATAAFLIAILLFLLPFAEIKCNNTAIANNTGFGIALGSDWKELASKNLFGNGFGNDTTTDDKKFQKQDSNIFAKIALGLGILGLLIALLAPRSGGKINLIIGLLAAVSLIAMLIDLRAKARSDNSVKSSDLGINAGVSIIVEGTGWFYFTIILFILAGIFSYLRIKNKQPN
jgi:hypothetical protein